LRERETRTVGSAAALGRNRQRSIHLSIDPSLITRMERMHEISARRCAVRLLLGFIRVIGGIRG
jgi:hypothetical protein